MKSKYLNILSSKLRILTFFVSLQTLNTETRVNKICKIEFISEFDQNTLHVCKFFKII